jgi:hypothetical protein
MRFSTKPHARGTPQSAILAHPQDEELSLMDRRVIALSLLSRLPVLSLAVESPDPLAAASAATGETWPTFFTPNPQDDTALLCEASGGM